MSHNARTRAESIKLLNQPWRLGRRVGRNVYALTGDAPSDSDVIIGQVDSEWLAADIVTRHNLGLIHAEINDGSNSPNNDPVRTSTHWEECWRVHLDCAVAKIERLLAGEPFARASMYGGSMTCGRCGKTWDIGPHIIGSTTHHCDA